MTTQKEIDEAFVATTESILQICEKTTSGNVSHNIATIKYKCRDMLQFYKDYPVSHWHSVKDGELPKTNKVNGEDTSFIVKTKCGNLCIACFAKWFDEEYRTFRYDFFDNSDCLLDVEYWMEMPELPTE